MVVNLAGAVYSALPKLKEGVRFCTVSVSGGCKNGEEDDGMLFAVRIELTRGVAFEMGWATAWSPGVGSDGILRVSGVA